MIYCVLINLFIWDCVEQRNGEIELKAVHGELLHNAREREAKEEGSASEPGESGASV